MIISKSLQSLSTNSLFDKLLPKIIRWGRKRCSCHITMGASWYKYTKKTGKGKREGPLFHRTSLFLLLSLSFSLSPLPLFPRAKRLLLSFSLPLSLFVSLSLLLTAHWYRERSRHKGEGVTGKQRRSATAHEGLRWEGEGPAQDRRKERERGT